MHYRLKGISQRMGTSRLGQIGWRWSKKGFWAVTDQGLFAASNFLLNLLLARWLLPTDYGAFTVAFTISAFVGVLHTSLLTEPMMVFGPGRHKERLSEYVGALFYGHLGFVLLSSSSLILVGLGFLGWGSTQLSTVLLALAFTSPLIYFLWLMRWACYARLTPHTAAFGGGIYMVLMLFGAYILYWRGWLSAISALVVMGVSSLMVSLWLAIHLKVRVPSREDELTRDALKKHWEYGRWSVATRILYWTPTNIYYLLLPIWGGFAASASLRALMNLILPILNVNIALSALLVTYLARAREGDRFRLLVRYACVPFVVGPVLYWMLLGVFHGPVVALLYGGKYSEHADQLWLLGLIPIAVGVTQVASSALKALERPDRLFWAYIPSTAVALPIGVASVFIWGTTGAVIALVFTYAMMAVAVSWVYLRSEK